MNVLIVDDESLIREGLASQIDWEELGFHAIDTAEDGISALAHIELTPPDLILTDIRMPFMTGLELAEKVLADAPDACIVIISGHDEFDYAKAAIKLSVFDYIMKPINLHEITDTIKRAKVWIEQEQLRKENSYYKLIFNDDSLDPNRVPIKDTLLRQYAGEIEDLEIKALQQVLAEGRNGIEAELDKIKTRFKSSDQSHRVVLQMVCGNIFLACKSNLENCGGDINVVFDDPMDVFQSIVYSDSIDSMFQKLMTTIFTVIDYRDALMNNHHATEIESAKQYIKQNYNSVQLNLNAVAGYVMMSPCHFSTVFKKVTGFRFIHYLTRIRMQKACELLKNTQLKTYEVAFETGYDNPTYFSTIFKKSFGVTPNDFRKQNTAFP